ncbi:MAG: TetR family transcriptional regulator [Steroidobacteraceae bacterium]
MPSPAKLSAKPARKASRKSLARATARSFSIEVKPTRGSAELLLAATASLLSERPDMAASFRDIEKRSGLNSALIKYYFGNKEGLLMALLERDAKLEMDALRHLVATAGLSAAEKLRIHITGILNAFYKSPYLNSLIHHMIDNASERSRKLLKKVYIDPMVEAYRQIVAQGVAEGAFRSVNAEMLYCSLVGSCDYLFSSASIVPQMLNEARITEELKQRYIAHVVDMTLFGMRK